MQAKEFLEDEEINLLDYWRVVWKHKNVVIIIFFTVIVIAFVKNINSPKIYESTATALPPEIENKGIGALYHYSGSLSKTLLPNLSSAGSNTSTIIAMLKSRRMAEDIVNKFNLNKLWKSKFLTDAIGKVQGLTKISMSPENLISITVESEDEKLAADIANFYVSNLNRMNDNLELTSAKPIVRVLDVAKPAERKSKPKIKQNILLAGVIGLIFGIFVAFIKEYIICSKKNRSS